MKFVIFKSPKRLEYARKLCIKHKLYVEGWSFQRWLRTVQHIEAIVIVFRGNIPIANFVLRDVLFYPNCGIFVVDNMRNKGIGKALMNHVQKSFPDIHLLTGYGIEGTNIFFEKCKH